MKVYVDKLPKSCYKCPCMNEDYERGRWCNIETSLDIQTDYDKETFTSKLHRQRHEGCPLQSLADYTKRVRKEVLEQVYKVFITEDVWSELKSWWLQSGTCEELKACLNAMIEETSVENIVKKFGHHRNFYQMLDQIQGETK